MGLTDKGHDVEGCQGAGESVGEGEHPQGLLEGHLSTAGVQVGPYDLDGLARRGVEVAGRLRGAQAQARAKVAGCLGPAAVLK